MKDPNSAWHSKLDIAAQCLYRYKREYIDGIEGDRGFNEYQEFGLAVHAAIEALFEGDDPAVEFKIQWEARKTLPITFTRYKWGDLNRIGQEFIRKFVKLHYPHITPILFEKRIYGNMGEHLYEGTPDLYGWYRGKLAVMDFKTSSQRYAREKLKVAKQLMDYTHLLEQNGHPRPTHVIYFVFIKATEGIQVLEDTLDEVFLRSVEENNKQVLDDLKARQTFPKNFRSCLNYNSKCPHWGHCHGKT